MGLFKIKDISVKGITCCVPKNVKKNIDLTIIPKEDIRKFIDNTGIEERRIVTEDICSSDLCFSAAEDLIKSLNWDKNEIEILVFVSQTADYILPVTSTILQDRLGLSTNCIAFDVPLGCSGYVYGISIISGMMKAAGLNKGLLLAGDTISKISSTQDKSTLPLFGDAGSATALQLDKNSEGMFFDLGSDGSVFKSIIVKDGGSRNKINKESLKNEVVSNGIERNACNLVLDGMDVFSFGISQAPKTVNKLLDNFNIEKENIDYFVFHQANMMMNKLIVKKLKLDKEKVLYSLKEYGNTSSASIPVTMVTQLKKGLIKDKTKFVLCGFGVGLSWGTTMLELEKDVVLNMIEL